MRALVVTSPRRLELVERPDPRPRAGEIRIKTAGAGINAADLRIIDGGFGNIGLGLDVAGVVDEVGPGVREFTVGTRVAAMRFPDGTSGTAADYVIVPAADAAVVPDGMDLLDAATVPVNSLTAGQLVGLLGPAEGRNILVTGAAGGVGGYVVALAAHSGWKVTGLARATDAEFLARAGAVETIDSLDGVTGFDVVLDTALINEAAIKPVRDNGIYVGVYPGKEPPSERGIVTTSSQVVSDGLRLRDMIELTAQGVLEVRRAGTVPFEKAALALDAFRSGKQRGRWVLIP